uniref:EGF-like domain-containing protein n=1 Tax=Setaria digitata TaxID=48799 RepID=A0A915PYP7_9BILA
MALTVSYEFQKNIRDDLKEVKEMEKSLTKAADEICDDEICNNQGTCIGSKETNFCICKLGYTGMHCENTPCDSTRDCNGKGLCIGTSSNYTCVCQLGFTGDRCEKSAQK